MSYDLMVFDPTSAPRSKVAFWDWYDDQKKASREMGRTYDPKSLTAPLQAWFLEMIETYPPLNGPLSTGDVDNPKMTDYGLGHTYVYACFGWSQAENAYHDMMQLAEMHGVGFFDISAGESEIWFPDSRGKLEKITR